VAIADVSRQRGLPGSANLCDLGLVHSRGGQKSVLAQSPSGSASLVDDHRGAGLWGRSRRKCARRRAILFQLAGCCDLLTTGRLCCTSLVSIRRREMSGMTIELAEAFARIALGHVGREYPNKLDHVLGGPEDARGPRALHPIFYGSFDWHSSVHSHWLLARLARRFPDIEAAPAIRAWLDSAFTPDKVSGELAYLERPSARGFERPYGWAWLLMLQAELEAHLTDEGRGWAAALRPLAQAFADRFRAWLPQTTYPVRAGTHANSAFAFVLARRYAELRDPDLAAALTATARRWYDADAGCQAWEPSGADFLSPALIEAECMRVALAPDAFAPWLAAFLPHLALGEPASLFTPAQVSDRTDGQIAHLDGLNLSRAWCWRRLAGAVPPPLRGRLDDAATRHLEAALPHLSADYMGEHWLASFALLALDDD
jgi:hypothetical protein